MLNIIEDRKELNRDEIIDKIIERYLDYIKDDLDREDYAMLQLIFFVGFEGLESYSDEELRREYEHYFDEYGNKKPDC